jgi:integrase
MNGAMSTKSTQKESEFYLSPREIERVVYAASGFRDRCILKLLWKTGIRRAEVSGLDVRDIDLAKKLLHIREGKGAKARLVPFDDELASDLTMHLGKRKTGPLFISNKGNSISVRAINDLVGRAGERAGVKHPNPRRRAINPHLFRHTFARQWKKNGGDLESLSKILGHTSVAMTIDLYGTKSVVDLQEDYRRVMEGR